MWPSTGYDDWKNGEITPPKEPSSALSYGVAKEVKKKKDECECKFCIKCIGYAIVDVLVMFKGIIKKLI
jgi:hypothetical protein